MIERIVEAYGNKQLKEVIKRKDREIEDIKRECANQFKQIRELCFCNSYGNKLDTRKRLVKINEIALENELALEKDLAIDKEVEEAKIIELTTRPMRISSIK